MGSNTYKPSWAEMKTCAATKVDNSTFHRAQRKGSAARCQCPALAGRCLQNPAAVDRVGVSIGAPNT